MLSVTTQVTTRDVVGYESGLPYLRSSVATAQFGSTPARLSILSHIYSSLLKSQAYKYDSKQLMSGSEQLELVFSTKKGNITIARLRHIQNCKVSSSVLKVMIKHLKLHLLHLLLYFYHIRKDPAIKRTSYLKSQSMITYISVLTLLLSCVPCTFNFRMRYSSLVCHALRALDT